MNIFPLPDDARAWVAYLRASLLDDAEAEAAVETPAASADLARRLREAVPRSPRSIAPEKTVGDLWIAQPDGLKGVSSLVLLTRVEADVARGVVACDRTWIAATDDVIVPADATTVGTALVACLWRDVPIDPAFLDSFVGRVEGGLIDAIRMLLQQRLTGGFQREPLGRISRDDVAGADEAAPRLLRWRITSPRGTVREFLTGPRLLSDDDPRTEAREAFYEATRHVEQRALQRLDEAQPESAPAVTSESVLAAALRRLREALRAMGAEIEDATAIMTPALVRGQATTGPAPSEAAGVVGLASTGGEPSASTDPSTFAAVVPLGDVSVELEFRANEARFGVAGVAYRGDDERPVAGVVATLRCEPSEGEPLELTRVTEAPEGDFGQMSVSTMDGATYSLRLSYEGVDAQLSW